jgi:hypothetical protein
LKLLNLREIVSRTIATRTRPLSRVKIRNTRAG